MARTFHSAGSVRVEVNGEFIGHAEEFALDSRDGFLGSVPAEAEGLVVPVPDDPAPAEGLGLVPDGWVVGPLLPPPTPPGGMTAQEWAFVRALCADRLDGDTAAVFADWLEENGRDAAGRRVRLLRPAPGDLLLLRTDAPLPAHEYEGLLNTVRELRDKAGVRAAVLLGPGQDLRVADPEGLRAAGWVRREEVDRMAAHAESVRLAAAELARGVAHGARVAAAVERSPHLAAGETLMREVERAARAAHDAGRCLPGCPLCDTGGPSP